MKYIHRFHGWLEISLALVDAYLSCLTLAMHMLSLPAGSILLESLRCCSLVGLLLFEMVFEVDPDE